MAALLTETTSSLTEASPARTDVADFLRRLKPDDGHRTRKSNKAAGAAATKGSPGLKAAHTRAVREYERVIDSRAPRAIVDAAYAKVSAAAAKLGTTAPPHPSSAVRAHGTAAVHYWLLGEERVAKNAKEAYVAVFAALAERDPDFLNRLAPKLRRRKNRGVAQVKQDLSSNDRAVNSSVHLPGDWWLLTHLNNAGKIRSLRTACEAAGIRFGNRDGLDISLPNA